MPLVISAVIPSYNGKELLASCLPALAAELQGIEHEVIVVDDGSTDGTSEWLAEHWPQVKVAQGRRAGFAAACNVGLLMARGWYVLLLNNDMIVQPGTVERLIARLRSNLTYLAVGGAYQTPAGEGEYRCSFCGNTHPEGYRHEEGMRPALDAPAGGGLFRRDALRKLGWLDETFTPFYWEDVDLGWNAWRAGYRVVFDAQAVMLHRHGATIQRVYPPVFYEAVRWKNTYVFAWKNCGRRILLRHLARIPWRGVRAVAGGYGRAWLWGLAMAVRTLPQVLVARRHRLPAVETDQAILTGALPEPGHLLRQLY